MIIISDTSPINYLVLIAEIELLPKLFDKVIIPQAVLDELQQTGTPEAVKDWINSRPNWLEVQSANFIDQTITLGAGKREAISLAKELNADLVLIDDRKARKMAIERGLNVAGTIKQVSKSFAGFCLAFGVPTLVGLRRASLAQEPAKAGTPNFS